MKRLQIRGHRERNCSEEKKLLYTVPDRCIAANRRNVLDLSKCIFVHNIRFFGD